MHRSLPGQQAGSMPAYQQADRVSQGRTPNAGLQAVAGGVEWVGDHRPDIPGPPTCIATRKDGNPCVAKPIGEHEHCIGHLSRGSEGIA